MDTVTTAKVIGVITGLIVGAIIVAIIAKIANKNHTFKTEYDERQKVLRGQGYRYGFYGMIILATFNILLGIAGVELPMEPAVVPFVYIVVGVLINCVYCILKDAYWGLNNNRIRYIIIFIATGIVNLIVPIRAAVCGELIVDGKLSLPGINLLCSAMLLLVGIVLVVKDIIDRSGEE